MKFPNDFRWGVATAAYQIEGAVDEGGRGPSIWDTFSRVPGAVKNGETGDVACDHYHRYAEDVRLMRDLGVNAYRFSIAWPRIFPEGTGEPNAAGLDFYDRLVDALLDAGVEPWATLYHWDLPQALQDRGGWPNRETADAFAAYADTVARRLGDRVHNWMTLNEPWVVSFLGHMLGEHAPGLRDLTAALRTSHHLLVGHGKAVEAVRAAGGPETRVGIVNHMIHIEPATDRPADVDAATRLDGQVNRWFLDPIMRGTYPEDLVGLYGFATKLDEALPVEDSDMRIVSTPLDFVGVNYYTRFVVEAAFEPPLMLKIVPQPGEQTAMGWEVYPEGLYDALVRVHREYGATSVYVTESGAAFDDEVTAEGEVRDPRRTAYLESHIAAAARAADDGVPLGGYFVWSLLDNFEWAEGYSKRFGIVRVDYDTQHRTVKESGRWYSRLIGKD
jgi:beta-glucosidase